MADLDVYNGAEAILAMCVSVLGSSAPVNAYVSPTIPSLDCDTLAIWTTSIQIPPITSPTAPAPQLMHKFQYGHFNMVTYQVVIARCVSVSGHLQQSPTVRDLNSASSRILQDGWMIWNGLKRAHKSGALFPPSNYEFQMDPAIPITGQGGVGGWTINVQVNMSGYTPTGI